MSSIAKSNPSDLASLSGPPGRGFSVHRPFCPACGALALKDHVRVFGTYRLYPCPECGLRFWDPRQLPDEVARVRPLTNDANARLSPIGYGHRIFFSDPLAPRTGSLLDVGCGTGTFLISAWNAGYRVVGLEPDPIAARPASSLCGSDRVLPFTVQAFAEQTRECFDVVTFFDVLEYQTHPSLFLRAIHSVVKTAGYIALSVPNRQRWHTGADPLDYPPHSLHLWNSGSLRPFLAAHGFEVLSMREQNAGIRYTARVLKHLIQPKVEGAGRGQRGPSPLRWMRRAQAAFAIFSCFPLALTAMPYVKWRRLRGATLYCLARKKDF